MKKLTHISVAILVFLFVGLVSSCQQSKDSTNAESKDSPLETAKVEYTCTMHPEVIQDKPGKCPKCGMDLVEKGGDHAHDKMDSTNHEH